MVDGEDEFAGFEQAELIHARGLATGEAEAICRRHLERGTWKRAVGEWTMLAERTGGRADSTIDRLGWFEAWVDAVCEEGVDPPHHEALRLMVGWALFWRPPGAPEPNHERLLAAAKRLVRWLCAKAGPGAAGCCAEVLSRAYLESRVAKQEGNAAHMHARLFAAEFTPLARHLLVSGVAELRSSSHDELLGDIIRALEQEGPPELLVVAFEILLARGQLQELHSHDDPSEPWWLTEAALVADLAPSRCRDVLRAPYPHKRDRWAPLCTISFPKCARALEQGLVRDSLGDHFARDGWVMMVLYREPSELAEPPTQAAVLRLAETLQLEILSRVHGEDRLHEYLEEGQSVDHARVARWVDFAAKSILDFAGRPDSRESQRFVAQRLKPLASWSSNLGELTPTPTIAKRMLGWLEHAEPGDRALALAATILRTNPSPNYAVAAALHCLASAPTTKNQTTPPSDEWLESLRVEFERFVCRPWNTPIFGISMKAILAGLNRIEFQDDLSELVILTGSTIQLHPVYYRDVCRRSGPGDESLALCMLYFVHELLHVPQGISARDTVQRLRAVGAELTLMHLDLTADHAAILLVHEAVPRWPIAWLKRLVSTSLASFPSSSFHTQAARSRKSLRLCSARVDALARERAAARLEGLGYLFIDFAPAGGDLFLLGYGPPMRVLAQAPLSSAEAKRLHDAAEPPRDGDPPKPSIDDLLVRLLDAWKVP